MKPASFSNPEPEWLPGSYIVRFIIIIIVMLTIIDIVMFILVDIVVDMDIVI